MSFRGMELGGLKRKQLQALCKKHGLPANKANRELVLLLFSALKVNENENSEGHGEVANEGDTDIKDLPRKLKKVKFSPDVETREYEPSAYKQTNEKVMKDNDALKASARGAKCEEQSKITGKVNGTLGRTTRSMAQKAFECGVNTEVAPVATRKRQRGGRTKESVGVENVLISAVEMDKDVNVKKDEDELDRRLVRRQLRSREVVIGKNGEGDSINFPNLRRNLTQKGSKKGRNDEGSDAQGVSEDNLNSREETKLKNIPMRPKRNVGKDECSTLVSDESGKTEVVGRITRARAKVEEKDINLIEKKTETREIQNGSEHVLPLEEPSKSLRTKSLRQKPTAAQEGEQSKSLAGECVEVGMGVRRMKRNVADCSPSEPVLITEAKKAEDAIRITRSRAHVSRNVFVAQSEGEMGKEHKVVQLGGLKGLSRNSSKRKSVAPQNEKKETDGSKLKKKTKMQSRNSNLESVTEIEAFMGESFAAKPLRRSMRHASKSELDGPSFHDVVVENKKQQRSFRMPAVMEEDALVGSISPVEELPTEDTRLTIPEAAGNKPYLDSNSSREIFESSNKMKGSSKNRSSRRKGHSVGVSDVHSDMSENFDAKMNLNKILPPASLDIGFTTTDKETSEITKEHSGIEEESMVVLDDVEKLVPDVTTVSGKEDNSRLSLKSGADSENDNLAGLELAEQAEFQTKAVDIINGPNSFPSANQSDVTGLKKRLAREEILTGREMWHDSHDFIDHSTEADRKFQMDEKVLPSVDKNAAINAQEKPIADLESTYYNISEVFREKREHEFATEKQDGDSGVVCKLSVRYDNNEQEQDEGTLIATNSNCEDKKEALDKRDSRATGDEDYSLNCSRENIESSNKMKGSSKSKSSRKRSHPVDVSYVHFDTELNMEKVPCPTSLESGVPSTGKQNSEVAEEQVVLRKATNVEVGDVVKLATYDIAEGGIDDQSCRSLENDADFERDNSAELFSSGNESNFVELEKELEREAISTSKCIQHESCDFNDHSTEADRSFQADGNVFPSFYKNAAQVVSRISPDYTYCNVSEVHREKGELEFENRERIKLIATEKKDINRDRIIIDATNLSFEDEKRGLDGMHTDAVPQSLAVESHEQMDSCQLNDSTENREEVNVNFDSSNSNGLLGSSTALSSPDMPSEKFHDYKEEMALDGICSGYPVTAVSSSKFPVADMDIGCGRGSGAVPVVEMCEMEEQEMVCTTKVELGDGSICEKVTVKINSGTDSSFSHTICKESEMAEVKTVDPCKGSQTICLEMKETVNDRNMEGELYAEQCVNLDDKKTVEHGPAVVLLDDHSGCMKVVVKLNDKVGAYKETESEFGHAMVDHCFVEKEAADICDSNLCDDICKSSEETVKEMPVVKRFNIQEAENGGTASMPNSTRGSGYEELNETMGGVVEIALGLEVKAGKRDNLADNYLKLDKSAFVVSEKFISTHDKDADTKENVGNMDDFSFKSETDEAGSFATCDQTCFEVIPDCSQWDEKSSVETSKYHLISKDYVHIMRVDDHATKVEKVDEKIVDETICDGGEVSNPLAKRSVINQESTQYENSKCKMVDEIERPFVSTDEVVFLEASIESRENNDRDQRVGKCDPEGLKEKTIFFHCIPGICESGVSTAEKEVSMSTPGKMHMPEEVGTEGTLLPVIPGEASAEIGSTSVEKTISSHRELEEKISADIIFPFCGISEITSDGEFEADQFFKDVSNGADGERIAHNRGGNLAEEAHLECDDVSIGERGGAQIGSEDLKDATNLGHENNAGDIKEVVQQLNEHLNAVNEVTFTSDSDCLGLNELFSEDKSKSQAKGIYEAPTFNKLDGEIPTVHLSKKEAADAEGLNLPSTAAVSAVAYFINDVEQREEEISGGQTLQPNLINKDVMEGVQESASINKEAASLVREFGSADEQMEDEKSDGRALELSLINEDVVEEVQGNARITEEAAPSVPELGSADEQKENERPDGQALEPSLIIEDMVEELLKNAKITGEATVIVPEFGSADEQKEDEISDGQALDPSLINEDMVEEVQKNARTTEEAASLVPELQHGDSVHQMGEEVAELKCAHHAVSDSPKLEEHDGSFMQDSVPVQVDIQGSIGPDSQEDETIKVGCQPSNARDAMVLNEDVLKLDTLKMDHCPSFTNSHVGQETDIAEYDQGNQMKLSSPPKTNLEATQKTNPPAKGGDDQSFYAKQVNSSVLKTKQSRIGLVHGTTRPFKALLSHDMKENNTASKIMGQVEAPPKSLTKRKALGDLGKN